MMIWYNDLNVPDFFGDEMVQWFYFIFQMMKWSNGEIFLGGGGGEMVKSWYDTMIWICQYGFVVKWYNGFCILFQIGYLIGKIS